MRIMPIRAFRAVTVLAACGTVCGIAAAVSPHAVPAAEMPAERWAAPEECLYRRGEPRVLAACVPPPPCDPSKPPNPYDLVGVAGVPTCGPIYRGPCEPRTGSHDDLHFWRWHRAWDRLFDLFYTAK